MAFMIVGTPRSGTTLVQRLACELDGVAVPPETHFFALFVRALLARRTFPLDAAAIDAEARAFLRLRTSTGLRLDPVALVERLGGRCDSPFELFCAIVSCLAHAPILGEKTPNHLLWWRPVSIAEPRMRFVVVVRDPRAVAASYRATWGTERHFVTAERWLSDQRQSLQLLDELGPRALLLRYEDIVRAPDAARSSLARFVGAQARTGAVDGRLGLEWESWKQRATEPIDTRSVSRWRDVLAENEARDVASICGRTMSVFGYQAGARRIPGPKQASERMRFRVRRSLKLARIRRTRLC